MSLYQKNVLLKKNIILIPADYDGVSNQKGVLSLNYSTDKVIGNLRCYNLKNTDEQLLVGVQVGDEIYKTKVKAKELCNLKIELKCSQNNSSKVNCVILSLNQSSYNTVLWGSTVSTKELQGGVLIQNMLEKVKTIESQEKQLFNKINELNLKKQTEVNELELSNQKKVSELNSTYNNEIS